VSIETTFAQSRGMGRKEGEQGGGEGGGGGGGLLYLEWQMKGGGDRKST